MRQTSVTIDSRHEHLPVLGVRAKEGKIRSDAATDARKILAPGLGAAAFLFRRRSVNRGFLGGVMG